MEEDLNLFLSHWFAGYMEGLVSLDTAQQDIMLAACGRACANSYTEALFRKAWENTGGDISPFLENLSGFFPEAQYTQVDINKIHVIYTHCTCDLVSSGLVENPMQCLCSLHNLKANFEAVFGIGVRAEMKETILSGDKQCRFLVSWSAL